MAEFVGLSNRLAGEVRGGEVIVRGCRLPLVEQDTPDGQVVALVRPEAVSLASRAPESGSGSGPLTGTVIAITFLGATSRVTVDLGDTRIMAQLPTSEASGAGGGQPRRAGHPPRSGAGVGRRGPGCGGGRGRSVSGRHPPLTIHRRLGHGAVLRHGRSAPYRAIEIGAGEPHLVRDDFTAAGAQDPEGSEAVGGSAGHCSAWFTSPTCSSPTSSRRRGSSS